MSFWSVFLRLFSRPKTPPSVSWTMHIDVSPADAEVRLAFKGTTKDENWEAGPGGQPHRVITFDSRAQPNVKGVLSVVRQGYVSQSVAIADIGPPSRSVRVALQPAVPPVLALVPEGSFFTLSNGERHTLIDVTSFKSYKLFLDGGPDAVRPHFAQLQDIGFNCHRVFLMCRNLFDFNPSDYGERFFAALPDYVRFAAGFGLRSNLCAFPDCADYDKDGVYHVGVLPRLGDQQVFWSRLGDALRPVSAWVLISHQNEADQQPNIIDSAAFSTLDGLLCSHGSNGSRTPPVRPWWDWEEYHTNEVDQWMREPHNAMEFSVGDAGGHITPSRVPMHMSENKRPDKDGNPQHHHDAAKAAALLVAGYCFHSASLRQSDVIDGLELECARATVAGMKEIPLACQLGPYRHRSDLERPDAGATGERAYQRGDADECIAHIRP